ncbi:MAG: hypothetical protein ACRC6R_06040 [Bacteroidales bacterium]
MTEQTKTENKLHPMASAMFAFVNEALTLPELEARLGLMENVVKNITADLAKIKAENAPEDFNPETSEVLPIVEPDEVIESAEEARLRKIAEYAASLEMETESL